MAIIYEKKKRRQNHLLYTFITTILVCIVFLYMVSYIYNDAQEEAYEMLHLQTKQIKDDLNLQLLSDRENLVTMANFAAKLYSDGEGYDLMFESFKPIGLIENIGILNPDNTFVTKAGSVNLDGLISFAEEKEKGTYISGRVADLTNEGHELIRSAVPIIVNDETVGVLYGVIKLSVIGAKYEQMAKELDAQLFVYDKETGNLVIDTVHDELGNISFLEDRTYNEDYSYEQLISNDKGFLSFQSAYKKENLHMHYSTLDELGWMIAFGRYDSQVFNRTSTLTHVLFFTFILIVGIIALYVLILMSGEKRINVVTNCASEVRKELLQTVDGQNNIAGALELICKFARARSAMFFDTNGDDYNYIMPGYESEALSIEGKNYFKNELIHYATEIYKSSKATLNVLGIRPNKQLQTTNPEFYTFLKKYKISDVSFAAIMNNTNHITILGVTNAGNKKEAIMIAEKIAACFSMALHNKNYVNKTEIEATTDSLTGTYNRVEYKNDLLVLDEQKAEDFSCIYVDVNELHIRNNKYGHAAGDEMLVYIANTLRKVFYGHKVYRMGGDEFLVFCENTAPETVDKNIEEFLKQLKPKNYHVAIGIAYRKQNNYTEDVVNEAEQKMYEAKAEYYQNKEKQNATMQLNTEFVRAETGIPEIDTMLSVLKESYNGIYRVALDTDKAKRILMPAYLNYNEKEEHYSVLFSKYVEKSVHPDYQRAMLSFLNYDAIKHQLKEGKNPSVNYKKNDGEYVILSVYQLGENMTETSDTLWVFAKK